MTGFLLITTREGKLLYISENVTEYLGHSMVSTLKKTLINHNQCDKISLFFLPGPKFTSQKADNH